MPNIVTDEQVRQYRALGHHCPVRIYTHAGITDRPARILCRGTHASSFNQPRA